MMDIQLPGPYFPYEKRPGLLFSYIFHKIGVENQ